MVTLLAGPTFIPINTFARPAGSTRSRWDNQGACTAAVFKLSDHVRALLARAKDATHLHTPNWHFPLTSHSAETFPFSYIKFQGLLKFLLERCSWKSKGCLHEKTRTGASFVPGWLSDFASRLHNDWVISYLVIWRYTPGRFKIATLRMRYPFQSTGRPISHRNETCGLFAFTWYRCEISYRGDILAPVQQPGWTHAGVTRAGMTFCGGIM